MRKKLTSLLVGLTAAPAVWAATPEEAYPEKDPYSAMSVNGNRIYAKTESLGEGEDYLIEMSKVAQQDILFLEPSNMDAEDMAGFVKLPVLNAVFPPLLKTGMLSKKWQAQVNKLEALNRDSNRSFFFMNLLITSGAYAGGNNYSSLRFNQAAYKACIVMGDLDIEAAKLAQNLGAIPQSQITDDFKSRFSDRKSLLMMVLLHEAAHCTQSGGKSFEGQHEILKYEIDADRKAIERYRELIATGWKLDPELPEKLQALRRLAPILGSRGSVSSVMANLMQNHATASGLNEDNPDAEKVMNKNFESVLLQRAVAYELLSPEMRGRLRLKAQSQVDKVFNTLTEELEDSTPKMRRLISELLTALEDFKPVMVNLTISDMALKENPSLAYEALEILADHDWKDAKDESEPSIREMAKESLDAWKKLSLLQPSRELPPVGLSSENMERTSQFGIVRDLSALQKKWNSPHP